MWKKAKINLIIPALTENREGKCLDLNGAFILKLLIPLISRSPGPSLNSAGTIRLRYTEYSIHGRKLIDEIWQR